MKKLLAVVIASFIVGVIALHPEEAKADTVWLGTCNPNGSWCQVVVGYGKKVCFNTTGTATTTWNYYAGGPTSLGFAIDAGAVKTDQVQFPGDCFKVQLLASSDRINFYSSANQGINVYAVVP